MVKVVAGEGGGGNHNSPNLLVVSSLINVIILTVNNGQLYVFKMWLTALIISGLLVCAQTQLEGRLCVLLPSTERGQGQQGAELHHRRWGKSAN